MDNPKVGIVMGSDSDWPKINKTAAALEEFGVGYEVSVMSAHRTPHVVAEYATTAEERGLKVIIARRGGRRLIWPVSSPRILHCRHWFAGADCRTRRP